MPHGYPTSPPGKIFDILFEYLDEIKCWHVHWDTATQYNDNGKLKYEYVWLEYCESPPENLDNTTTSATIQRYRIKTKDYPNVIKAKSLEKVLEGKLK